MVGCNGQRRSGRVQLVLVVIRDGAGGLFVVAVHQKVAVAGLGEVRLQPKFLGRKRRPGPAAAFQSNRMCPVLHATAATIQKRGQQYTCCHRIGLQSTTLDLCDELRVGGHIKPGGPGGGQGQGVRFELREQQKLTLRVKVR